MQITDDALIWRDSSPTGLMVNNVVLRMCIRLYTDKLHTINQLDRSTEAYDRENICFRAMCKDLNQWIFVFFPRSAVSNNLNMWHREIISQYIYVSTILKCCSSFPSRGTRSAFHIWFILSSRSICATYNERKLSYNTHRMESLATSLCQEFGNVKCHTHALIHVYLRHAFTLHLQRAKNKKIKNKIK